MKSTNARDVEDDDDDKNDDYQEEGRQAGGRTIMNSLGWLHGLEVNPVVVVAVFVIYLKKLFVPIQTKKWKQKKEKSTRGFDALKVWKKILRFAPVRSEDN